MRSYARGTKAVPPEDLTARMCEAHEALFVLK
ncbi:hypothetical protein EDD76_12238 [Kineothrix alysoides]|uniref:Uncharacterized protein n=1 Tax=Kineothrix alysoides TaxID=1469948 RepID=A0A4R1QKD7_9FIRM|nr:hypothetical protein EDD76_12238 [Kineothrix alysoides]